METNIHLWSYLAQFFLEWEMLRSAVVEEIKTHILCSVTFFQNLSVYEITWKTSVEPGRPRRKYGACTLRAGYLRLQTRTQNI